MDVLQSEAEATHPVFEILDTRYSGTARPGQLWRLRTGLLFANVAKRRLGAVVECWEPFGRQKSHWITLVGLGSLSQPIRFECSDAEL